MKHATSRILFGYWDALRGERVAPERRDVQPGAIRHVLADTFVLELALPNPSRFRLAGTRMEALFGRSLVGTGFDGLFAADDRDGLRELVATLATEAMGSIAGVSAVSLNGSELSLELLILPLRHRGRTDARAIGALSPGTIPPWAGLVPLSELRLRSSRVIEPARSRAEDRPVRSLRQRFVVHDGGLA